MPDQRPSQVGDLDAGEVSPWLDAMLGALAGDRGSDVPCGPCTACCRASQFVHIEPDETDTLAHVPAELLFPAPGLPHDHVLLGYDEHGHCPMLGDGGCSIYIHRPRTCRSYDCRVFPAAGLDADAGGDATKVDIARRARRWRFRVASDGDRARLDAVRAAAAFLREHREELADGSLPSDPTRLAVLAVELHDLFLPDGERGDGRARADPRLGRLRTEVARTLRGGPAPARGTAT